MKSKWKYALSYLGLLLGFFFIGQPIEILAACGTVHVIVENTTYPVEEGAPWDGVLVDCYMNFDEASTMMSVIAEAVESVGAQQVGAEDGYIEGINDLWEFDGGAKSGWMGTLNDWFTNVGFDQITAADGDLMDGDEIHVIYTRVLGADLGADKDNTSKNLVRLGTSAGMLSPEFDENIYEYTLTVPENVTGIKVMPTASNRNYQVQIQAEGITYRRTQMIPIADGMEILLTCGDSSQAYILRIAYRSLTEQEREELEIQAAKERFEEGTTEASVKAVSYHKVQIKWKEYENADYYKVYRKTSKGKYKEIAQVDGCSYTDDSAKTGITYYYTVKACSRKWGDVIYSKYPKDLSVKTKLSQATISKVQSAGYNSLKVSWKKISGASGYQVYMKTSSGKKYVGTASSTSYTHKKLTTGKTYTYYVRAYRVVDGEKVYGAFSDTVKGKPVPKKAAISKITTKNKSVTLTWKKVSGASGYQVYYKTSKNGSWKKLTQLSKGSSVSYQHKKLKKGKSIYYKVRAYRTVSGKKIYGSYSEVKSIKVK